MAPRDSYGSINAKNSEDELTAFIPLPQDASVDKKKKYFVWVGLAIFGFAIGSALNIFMSPTKKAYAPSKPHHGGSSPSHNYPKDENLKLSELSPVDMGFLSIDRADDASPSSIWANRTGPLPTNSWYLNLVSHKAAMQPDDASRAYTVPYIIDTAPPKDMAGIRVHWPTRQASDRNVQMVDDFKNALCLGSNEIAPSYVVNPNETLSQLGVSLLWNNDTKKSMTTHIVRGMPYATMHYQGGALPTLYSFNGPVGDDSALVADGHRKLQCGTMTSKGSISGGKTVSVDQELQLHFINSDFTWGMYFSKPVQVQCGVTEGDEKTREFKLDVVSYDDGSSDLTVRVALLNQCTTGKSDIQAHCHAKDADKTFDMKQYAKIMKEGASVFPTNSHIHFEYPDADSGDRVVNMTIDWGAQSSSGDAADKKPLLMFALPHHQDQLSESGSASITKSCFDTFHGSTCLVQGNVWTMEEDLGAPMSFNAPRPPSVEAIPTLANALAEDIHYQLSDNLLRAASDTYFSGKMMARLARVIAIASEMNALALGELDSLNYDDSDEESLLLVSEAAASENLPSEEEILSAVEQLKKGVQSWLKEDAEAPFVFDKSWGGLVNCGCRYEGKGDHGHCNNTFPDCPALADVNEDFGNGYYNDHHYHYGYHIYAASVVAKYDPEWAEDYFEKVLLYIRDFANPSAADEFFTTFRQKDWFLGSSWASGIVSAENSPHGRNEESSSEAIAAYEGIALYGAVMTDIFTRSGDEDNLETAKLVRDAGQLLTATEVRATNRYWHVWSSEDHNNTYPAAYKQPVVGMLYDTMASFQTWFAPWAVVSYGIQLMPFTPVAEQRDDPQWAAELYPMYVSACKTAGDFCIDNGWNILQAGLCAEAGDQEDAMEQALSLSPKVFSSYGGNGNSLSNTIWFISTRSGVKSTSLATSATDTNTTTTDIGF